MKMAGRWRRGPGARKHEQEQGAKKEQEQEQEHEQKEQAWLLGARCRRDWGRAEATYEAETKLKSWSVA